MSSCAGCGTARRPDDDFCTQCGASAVRTFPPPRSVVPVPIVVGLVVALLAGVGAAAWYLLADGTDGSGAAANPTAGPAPLPGTTVPAVPVDPSAALAAQLEADRATAEESLGWWLPQISSKAVGMQLGGTVYDAAGILEEFHEANRRYGAFLVRSDDYSTFKRPGYMVTLVPQRFSDARAANSWCVTNGFRPVDCFAKRLSHTEAPDGNTLHWGP